MAPQDLVAIFHASFHPTQGNLVDWSLKASDDLNLDNIEFSVLPSGLHLVDRDVVYFTKDGQHGVCIFRRRKTQEEGQRGYRLSSLGILLARSRRPRPWHHTSALKDLVDTIYNSCEDAGLLQPTESHWEPARAFFEERKVRRADIGEWSGWSHDLGDISEPNSHPTLHLPHLLRILGPSSLTLYKHVLGRRRILIYTHPPVEAACILCYAAADMCYEAQSSTPGLSREPLSVLGMITLSDMDRLSAGSGWIACTTDAIFLEKPACYDLLIDLTHAGARPAFYVSKPAVPAQPRGPTHRLSPTRFSWSDIKLWNELDRILQLGHERCCTDNDSEPPANTSRFGAAWADAWRVYEEVCLVCAGLWMGLGTWRPANGVSDGRGAVNLEGDDDLGINFGRTRGSSSGSYVRSLGMGIEGRPTGNTTPRAFRRASAMSWSSGRATVIGAPGVNEVGVSKSHEQQGTQGSSVISPNSNDEADQQLRTTLALLQTLHAHTAFQLAILASFLPSSSPSSGIVYLSPKDMVQFELGPLSAGDARYLEWLALEYGGDTRVVVRRGWRELYGELGHLRHLKKRQRHDDITDIVDCFLSMGPVETVVHPEYKHTQDGATMKALAWFGNTDVRIVDAPVPDITEEDDVIDNRQFMGKVEKIGPNVKGLSIGQRVVASFQIACGECEYCKKKLSSFCDRTNNSSLQNYMYGQRDAGFFGYSHFTGGFPGGQAEYVRVPKGAVNLLPIPDGVSDEQALYLSDVLPTSYHSVVDTHVEKGDIVGIWGLGPIGQCAARWAILKGASRVIGIDTIPERLALGQETGIDIIDFQEFKDVPKRIYELVPRGLDVAIDCGTFHEPKSLVHKIQKTLMLETDSPETINEMLFAVRKGGRCGIIAAYAGLANGVNVGALMEKGARSARSPHLLNTPQNSLTDCVMLRLIGNGQAPVHKYWKEILNEYIIPGKFDPTFMITHRVPIEDFAELYDAFDQRKSGVEKVFVETRFSAPSAPGCPKTTRVADWEV
ncbi:hypothetical protein DXG01_002649 [Tephrocybe rancida]|nr:hypothetical protein DXG01_002649 [Tephrocybe rancida]